MDYTKNEPYNNKVINTVGDFKLGGKSLANEARHAGEKLGEMASDLRTTGAEYIQTGREYVRENPSKGVAIAAATGAIIGSLFTLAMRRRQ